MQGRRVQALQLGTLGTSVVRGRPGPGSEGQTEGEERTSALAPEVSAQRSFPSPCPQRLTVTL